MIKKLPRDRCCISARAALLVVVAALLVAGCGGTTRSATAETSRGPGESPGRVVATIDSEALLKNNARTLAQLVASPELALVVRGFVQKVDYTREHGLEDTVMTVDVTRVLRGHASNTVVVHEDGGFVLARQLEAENVDKFPGSKPSGRPGDMVDIQFEGAAHPVVGDDVVLFLSRDPNAGREGQYQEVGSVYGRFVLGKAGRYVRQGSDPGKRFTVSIDAVASALGR